MKTENNIFSEAINAKFDIYDYRHASTIFQNDFPEEFTQFVELLENFTLSKEEILTPGGGKSPIAKDFDVIRTPKLRHQSKTLLLT